jgi:hypothetical protein
MEQKIILVIVILASVWAHIWLFLWMRFKMDEGLVLRCLKDLMEVGEQRQAYSLQALVDASQLKSERIEKVCLRSQEIELSDSAHFYRLKS